MTVKEFCEGYNKCVNQAMKDRFVAENLEIKKYVPFLEKDATAHNLAFSTMIDEDGKTNIKSSFHYLMFTRSVIELYTNLVVEKPSFYEEYDLLISSGVMTCILEKIPKTELDEFKTYCDMAQEDLIGNTSDIYNYVDKQVDKLATVLDSFLSPILLKIENINEDDMDNFVDKFSKLLSLIK